MFISDYGTSMRPCKLFITHLMSGWHLAYYLSLCPIWLISTICPSPTSSTPQSSRRHEIHNYLRGNINQEGSFCDLHNWYRDISDFTERNKQTRNQSSVHTGLEHATRLITLRYFLMQMKPWSVWHANYPESRWKVLRWDNPPLHQLLQRSNEKFLRGKQLKVWFPLWAGLSASGYPPPSAGSGVARGGLADCVSGLSG